LRRLLVAVGVAGAVVLAALFVAPSVIEWNGSHAALAAELSRATGRTVSLDGPIEATFLPAPRILANNVRLSGPSTDKSDHGDLLRLRAVELQVRLLPLLTGHIVVERLTLVRPEILVDTDETGRVTWVMDGAGGDLLPEVALQRFAISNGTLVWRDHGHGVRARIENISLRLSADSLSGPAKAEGSATIDDIPGQCTANGGRMSAQRKIPFNVSLAASSLQAKGEFIGQFLASEQRLTGRIKASGDDARATLAALLGPNAGQGTAAALIAHPFSLDGRVSATPQLVEASDVIVNLADQRATGTVRVSGGEGTHPKAIEAAFSAPRLDLDALATVPPLPATVDSRSVPLPRDLDIGLDFTSDAVLAAGKVVQGFSAKGALADGVIKIDGVEGQLPGAGSFRVSGSLAGQDRLRFEGNVAANAANLRDLLSWLQIDASSIPSGRLGHASLAAKLSADAERAELSDVDLHVDSTRAHGTARLDYRDKPSVHLDLAADHLDLDAYRSDDTKPLETAAATPVPGILSDISGGGSLAIGRMTYRGMDLRGVDLTATVTGGEFILADFSGVPPEPGEFLPSDTAEPLAAAAVPGAMSDSSVRREAPPPAASPSKPAAAAHEPASQPDGNGRESFIRSILDAIGH
jgi:uncharacterized protein involved in outer membrane biogenesis